LKPRLVALVLGVALIAATAWWLSQRHRGRPLSAGTLLIYNGATGDASLLTDTIGQPRRRTLPCVSFGRFAQRVGVYQGDVVALDTVGNAIARLALAQVDAIARGEARCEAGHNLVRSTKVHGGHVPYRGLFVGDRLYVSYFSDNLVEEYQMDGEPRFVRDIPFAAGENLGLSEMAAVGRTLMVTAAGYHCFKRDCPDGRFHASRLLFVDLDRPVAPFPEVRPAELNTCGIRSLDAERTFIVNAGDLQGGRSSVQRLDAKRTLHDQIPLPRAAGASSIHALSPATLAVLQMSGEHLFLIDATTEKLVRTLRFDGQTLAEAPAADVLPERSQANLQDLIGDPQKADRFYLVDEKGERLLHLRFHETDRTLELLRVTSLATDAFHAGPTWGVFLDAANAGRLSP
jgi:hypothetical protein